MQLGCTECNFRIAVRHCETRTLSCPRAIRLFHTLITQTVLIYVGFACTTFTIYATSSQECLEFDILFAKYPACFNPDVVKTLQGLNESATIMHLYHGHQHIGIRGTTCPL